VVSVVEGGTGLCPGAVQPYPNGSGRDAQRVGDFVGAEVGPGDEQQYVAFGGGQKFGADFAVDLTDLFRDWKFYFSSEGVPLKTALLVVIPAVVLALFLERFFPYLQGMVAFGISALLWLAALVQWSRWRYKNRRAQIAIEDLVQSASSGKWTKAVPEEIVRRMNKPKFYDRFIAR